jgi:hypothetical protein
MSVPTEARVVLCGCWRERELGRLDAARISMLADVKYTCQTGRASAHLVDELVASVVARVRAALGVLVRHARAERLHHRGRREVLGGDQLEPGDLCVETGRVRNAARSEQVKGQHGQWRESEAVGGTFSEAVD